MEDDRSKSADDAAERPTGGAPDSPQENGPPLVLPVVVVPAGEPQAANSDAAGGASAPAVENAARPSSEDGLPSDTSLPPNQFLIDPAVEIQRPPAGREIQLPLPAERADDEEGPDDDDMTFEEAIQHFVTLAEEGMRRLGLGPDALGGPTPYRSPIPGAEEVMQLIAGQSRARAARPGRESEAGEHAAGGPGVFSPTPAEPPRHVAPEQEGFRMPTLQVVVQLADARAKYDEAMGAALERAAPKFQAVAWSAVERGFRWYKDELRAADPSQRGPM